MKKPSHKLSERFPSTIVLIRFISWAIIIVYTTSALLIMLNTFIASIDMKNLARFINVMIIGTIVSPLSILVTLAFDFIRQKQALLLSICVSIILLILLLFTLIPHFKI